MTRCSARRPRLLIVVGSTGTGKTELAIALAEHLDGEIVGCDALQLYRGFDIATAKPDASQRARVPHHLVDWLDPRSDCSLADYVEAAEAAIGEIHRRGKQPLVAGGTGLYLRGLLRGVVEVPSRDAALRQRLLGIMERHGSPRMHRWLGGLDPASASRLAKTDRQRIVRALEVALSGDATWSERLASDGTWSGPRERYATIKLGLEMERQALHARIEQRVDRFFDSGLVTEVRELVAAGTPAGANAFKAIGYREVLQALTAREDPEAVRETVKRNTRRYAKRQRTWFRKEPGIVWLDATLPLDERVEIALAEWRRLGP